MHVAQAEADIEIEISDSPLRGPFAVICKIWPANPDLLLAAIPLMRDGPSRDFGHDGDLRILVLDRATLKVHEHLQLDGLMSDDAMRISDVSFDTARYDVAPGRRAFGLRISRTGSSRANPFSETSRSALQEGDCVEKLQDRGRTAHTLTFDGRGYRIPETLRSMDGESAG